MIAADLAIDVKTAALLSTAFAFPYALIQPVLGVTGDFFGRTRLMNACVLVMAIAALICAVASNFTLLVAMRIVAGLVAGGVFPVAMALLGDLVPMNQRQVAIARLLGIALTANVLGAAISGRDRRPVRLARRLRHSRDVLARGVAPGFLGIPQPAGAAEAPLQPRRGHRELHAACLPTRAPRSASARCSSKRSSSRDCSLTSRILLRGIGETRASIAGLLIGCFAVGGIFYSLVVPYLVKAVPQRYLMFTGGVIAAGGLALIAFHFSWQVQVAIYGAFGLGFYLLHSCIQVHVTDLSQTARGAAASLHSSSFYIGQAIGPVVYGFGFAHGGAEPTILLGAVVVLGVGIACAQLLRRQVAA